MQFEIDGHLNKWAPPSPVRRLVSNSYPQKPPAFYQLFWPKCRQRKYNNINKQYENNATKSNLAFKARFKPVGCNNQVCRRSEASSTVQLESFQSLILVDWSKWE